MFWKRKKGITAAELKKKLERDPEYRARRDAKLEEHRQQVAASREIEKKVLSDLSKRGVRADSLAQLRDSGQVPPAAVGVLLTWLERVERPNMCMAILGALRAAEEPFDGSALSRVFDGTDDDAVRWRIGDTIACAHPTGIATWLESRLRNSDLGRTREMLAIAAGEMLDPAVASEVLREVLPELPGHCAIGLASCGGQAELKFLSDRRGNYRGWVREEINNAIKQIKRRVRNEERA